MSSDDLPATTGSGDLPPRSGSSQRIITDKEGLRLMPIRQNQVEESAGWSGRAIAFGVLVCLWTYYGFFGWIWLTLFTEMGDDLLWAYFGLFTVIAFAMGIGVAKSMSAQRIGWWRKVSGRKDLRGTCCGFQLY